MHRNDSMPAAHWIPTSALSSSPRRRGSTVSFYPYYSSLRGNGYPPRAPRKYSFTWVDTRGYDEKNAIHLRGRIHVGMGIFLTPPFSHSRSFIIPASALSSSPRSLFRHPRAGGDPLFHSIHTIRPCGAMDTHLRGYDE